VVLDDANTPVTGTFSGSSDSSAAQIKLSVGSHPFHCGIHGTSMKDTLIVH